MVADMFKRSLSRRSFVPVLETNSHNLKADALFSLPGASASFHSLPVFRTVEFKIRVGDFDEPILSTRKYSSSPRCSQARSESDIARLTSQLSATSEKMHSLEHETREKDSLILSLSRSQEQLRSRLDDASDGTTQALHERDLARVQLGDALGEVEHLKCALRSAEADLTISREASAQHEAALKDMDGQVEEMRADSCRLRQTISELEGREDKRTHVERALREEIATLKRQLAASNDKCDALQAALDCKDDCAHPSHAYIAGLQDTLAVFEPEDRHLPVDASPTTDCADTPDASESKWLSGDGEKDPFVPRIALSVSSPSFAKHAKPENGPPFISMLRCSASAVLCTTTRTNALALSPVTSSFFTPSTPTLGAAASLASLCSSLALA